MDLSNINKVTTYTPLTTTQKQQFVYVLWTRWSFYNGCPIKLKNNNAASLSTIFLDDLDVPSTTASGSLNFITLGHINTTETTTNS